MNNYVNLDKALAKIRQYPGAHIDRKVFTVIAEKANDKGIVTIVPDICGRLHKIAEGDKVMHSLLRLEQHGFIANSRIIYDDISGHYEGTTTINTAYMLRTAGNTGNINALIDSVNNVTENAQRVIDAYIDYVTAVKQLNAMTANLKNN